MSFHKELFDDVLQQLLFKSTQPQNANKGSNIVLMNPEIHIHNEDRIPNSRKRSNVEADEVIQKLLAENKMKDEQIERARKQNEIMEPFLRKIIAMGMENFLIKKELCGSEQTINKEKQPKRRKKSDSRSESETNFENDSTALLETRNGTKFIHSVQNSNGWNQNAKEVDSQSSCSQQISIPKCTNFVVPPTTSFPASVPSSLNVTELTPISISFDEDRIPNTWIYDDKLLAAARMILEQQQSK